MTLKILTDYESEKPVLVQTDTIAYANGIYDFVTNKKVVGTEIFFNADRVVRVKELFADIYD